MGIEGDINSLSDEDRKIFYGLRNDLLTDSMFFNAMKERHPLIGKYHNFNISAGCIINKADLNGEVSAEIEAFLKNENVIHIASLPYDENFTAAMTEGQTIVEYDDDQLKEILIQSWDRIKEIA